MRAIVYITLLSQSSVDLISAGMINRAYSIEPLWEQTRNNTGTALSATDSVSVVMGFIASKNADDDTAQFKDLYKDIQDIISEKKINFYSLIVTENCFGQVGIGNIKIPTQIKKSNIDAKVIQFPSKIEKVADGIIEDNEVPKQEEPPPPPN